MIECVTIVPPNDADGVSTGIGTRVLMPDGSEVPEVARIEVTIAPDQPIIARIGVHCAFANFKAHPLLDLETLRESAAHHGFDLVRKDNATLAEGMVRY